MGDYNANPRKVIDKHPSCVEVGECRPQHRSAKNTRRWCKGRVDTPHTWEWQRRQWDLAHERMYGFRYNRITEVPVCFGCGKRDFRFRSYCRQCGEPWPELHHPRTGHGTWRWSDATPCSRCGAPWKTPRPKEVT